MKDKEVEKLIFAENARQNRNVNLIASENLVSNDVLTAMGSVFTNKYAEGYPGHRYYGGCEIVDKLESLAINRACALFQCAYANVQPHSGSQANRAVIEAVCQPYDTILSLSLDDGGHLTHGSPVSFAGKYYHIVPYHTDSVTGLINYKELIELAQKYHPSLIIAGASAYSREWDYELLNRARVLGNSILMFDMAHTAGLIAAGLLENPCKHCDIVTSTTHKTLRGPRGGIILMKQDFTYNGKPMSKLLNSSVFPGNQGGPLENIIAAKAVCFYEAMQPEFKAYQERVVSNTRRLASSLMKLGFKICTDGTDNHEFLIDLRHNLPNLTGKEAEELLQKNGIIVNKNMVPGDTRKSSETSGLRLGCAFMTNLTDSHWDIEALACSISAILKNE